MKIECKAYDLLRVLECEKRYYESLLESSKEKQEVVLSNDIEGLARVTKDEERLIDKIQQRERERLLLLNELAAYTGIPIDELKITKVAQLVEVNLSDRLFTIGKELKTILEELSAINRVNSKLIFDSLTFATHILDILTNKEREKSIYKEKGERERIKAPLAIDRMA